MVLVSGYINLSLEQQRESSSSRPTHILLIGFWQRSQYNLMGGKIVFSTSFSGMIGSLYPKNYVLKFDSRFHLNRGPCWTSPQEDSLVIVLEVLSSLKSMVFISSCVSSGLCYNFESHKTLVWWPLPQMGSQHWAWYFGVEEQKENMKGDYF